MKRYAAVAMVALAFAGTPCQAQQFLQKLEQKLTGGQGLGQQQGMMPGQQSPANVIGNVSLPPGQYMMTNTQSGQAFYVVIENGQMFLSGPGQQQAPQMMAPGQGMFQQPGMLQQQQQGGGGVGGMLKNELGNFLQNKLAPQQAPGQ